MNNKKRRITVDVQSHLEKQKSKVLNKLSWYNDLTKKVEYFEGGKLVFKYKKDPEMVKSGYSNPYRLLPEVEDIYIYKNSRSDNMSDIISSVVSGLGGIVSSNSRSVTIEVNEFNYSNLTRALDGRGIRYRNA